MKKIIIILTLIVSTLIYLEIKNNEVVIPDSAIRLRVIPNSNTSVDQNIKNKVKKLKQQVKNGVITSKEAKKYLAGHLGYLKIANVNNLKKEIFYTK